VCGRRRVSRLLVLTQQLGRIEQTGEFSAPSDNSQPQMTTAVSIAGDHGKVRDSSRVLRSAMSKRQSLGVGVGALNTLDEMPSQIVTKDVLPSTRVQAPLALQVSCNPSLHVVTNLNLEVIF